MIRIPHSFSLISQVTMQSRSTEDLRSTPSRSSSIRAHHTPGPLQSHRQSFTDSLRGHPPSPRATRQPSLSQAQLQELLNNPPTKGSADPRFAGRDWQHIGVGELCDPADLRWVEFDSGIEDATNASHISPALNLNSHQPNKSDRYLSTPVHTSFLYDITRTIELLTRLMITGI